ncbi:glycosyltransferase [Candidatus Magnetominusculus xianensis]|uniref:Glycosyl transferase family 2 n=1 Tax=Candidatus Magnetominusculus xianensis TaxID=1748249 RepID=A0ABR5SET9_9BACT|nr:glycosyltransferase [Candidatus Magnetominusculus xianensis]KWT82946.1 glycosyl transferase family 2 [Candidatus Magnetominusculus xianensis]
MTKIPLAIIIPVYNEGLNIGTVLSAIDKNVSTPHRIYLVYDFDEDDTLPAAQQFVDQGHPVTFMKNPQRGVVSAIKTGLKTAAGECLLVTMADMSDDYADVDKMYRLIEGGADIVCGSRYVRGGRQVGGPFIKKNLSRAAGLSLKIIAGLPTHDSTNSYKLYRRKVIETFEIESDGGFEIGLELVVKAHIAGFRIAEIPTVWHDRAKGQSRFKIIKWSPKYLKWYLYAMKNALFTRGNSK